MSEIEAKVKAIIVEKLGVDESEVKNEASFANDLGADSLDAIDIVMSLEDQYGIEVPDSVIESMKTVEDIVGFIESNITD